MPRLIGYFSAFVALIVLALAASYASACTGIRISAHDGSVIYARTLEFAEPLESQILFLPRNYEFVGTTASGRPGLTWHSKCAAVGMNGESFNLLVDGVNEHGLAAGGFYFPDFAGYQSATAPEVAKTIAPWEVPTWILTNFKTVDEVREALPTIRVAAAPINHQGDVPPLHYVTHDASGNSLVIEYVDGKLTTFENPIGVITNSPTFDWHIINLRNYINLTATNTPPRDLHGVLLDQLGQGSGMRGLPGDFTPPSRFVRAVALSQSAAPVDTGVQAVREAFHILNSFDIPRGAVRPDVAADQPYDCTQWTSACDLQALTYYFHTYGNRRVRCVELAKFDANSPRPVTIPIDQDSGIEFLDPPQETP